MKNTKAFNMEHAKAGAPYAYDDNAALRHEIDNGQVVTIEQHMIELGEAHVRGLQSDSAFRSARDMAVAQAVQTAALDTAHSASIVDRLKAIRAIDLPSIIGTVKGPL